MPTIDVKLVDVVKRFGDAVAVDHIDLEVRNGEFFSLLGPSGCGKTTTLRMIGGFEQPTSGLIELQGEDVTWLPPFKRNVNTVFQNYALFPHLTIFENVAFGLRRKGAKGSEVKERVSEMLKLVELPGYERRKPTQISGGQAQRVALARALINRPGVLLLDEPLGALDLKLRKQMQVELKRIQQEVGITFIYVTHDQEEAMTMSDRIAVMNKGRYEQLGDPESLYERPATRFVAGFLGISNLLPGTVAGSDGEYVAVSLADGTTVRAPRAAAEGHGAVNIGVRPEKFRLREETDHDPERPQPAARRRPRRVVSRREHAIPGRGPGRRPSDGLRAERRASDEVRTVGTGREGRHDLEPGPQLRRRSTTTSAPRRTPRPTPAPVRRPPPPDTTAVSPPEEIAMTQRDGPFTSQLTRRHFLQGSAMAGRRHVPGRLRDVRDRRQQCPVRSRMRPAVRAPASSASRTGSATSTSPMTARTRPSRSSRPSPASRSPTWKTSTGTRSSSRPACPRRWARACRPSGTSSS